MACRLLSLHTITKLNEEENMLRWNNSSVFSNYFSQKENYENTESNLNMGLKF